MGCNCNKRKKRVLRANEALSERAERIALAAGGAPERPVGPWPERAPVTSSDDVAPESS